MKLNKKLTFKHFLAIILVIIGGIYLTFRLLNSPQKTTANIAIEKQLENLSDFPETITGKVITLKKLKREDASAFHAMFSDDVRKNLSFPKHINFAYTSHYVNSLVSQMEQGLTISYIIFDNKKEILIGNIQIREPNVSKLGQLGMWLNENYRGGGKIQEAIKIITATYFSVKKNAKTIEANVEPVNERSYKVLSRAGFIETNMLDNPKRLVLELPREDVLNPRSMGKGYES
jgi:RimJ/RimL family protein N-acetyltransferase